MTSPAVLRARALEIEADLHQLRRDLDAVGERRSRCMARISAYRALENLRRLGAALADLASRRHEQTTGE